MCEINAKTRDPSDRKALYTVVSSLCAMCKPARINTT